MEDFTSRLDPKFDQLLSAKIKRLGKSTTVLDEPVLSNANSVGVSSKELILTSSSHTQHPDAIRVGDKNFYIAEFGKVYTGEIFRGLIILSNKGQKHDLNDVEFVVYSTCQNKNQTKTLHRKTIPLIPRASTFSQIIEIRADFTDTYVIELKARYKSEFFKERLRQLDIESMSPSQKSKLQNKESYKIDYATREVIRNFSKKFKFQTRSPFQLAQNIVVRKNQYFMELTLENITTVKVLKDMQLNVTNPDLDCLDLNEKDEEGEMVGSVMK